MFLSKLLPNEGQFFELANRHCAHVLDAARAFSRLVVNYADLAQRAQFTRQVDAAEAAANGVLQEFNQALYKTFVTPIDRGQLFRLSHMLDSIADHLRDAAETLALYDIQHLTPDVMRLSEIALLCCERLDEAIRLLPRLSKAPTGPAILALALQISDYETESDRIMHAAIGRLLREEPDVRELIKLKSMYEQIERVADCCSELSELLEGIVLDHA